MNGEQYRDKQIGNGLRHACLALLLAAFLSISATVVAMPIVPPIDEVTLKSGETVKCTVMSYANGNLKVLLPDRKWHTGLIEEVSKITFGPVSYEGEDELRLKNGSVVECSIIKYDDGILTVRLPDGVEQSGNISEIKVMRSVPSSGKTKERIRENQPLNPHPAPSRTRPGPPHPYGRGEAITINGRAEDAPRLQFDVERDIEEQPAFPDGSSSLKVDEVRMGVKIRNRDFSRALESGKGYIFAIARSLSNRKEYMVHSRESFDFPALKPSEDFEWQGVPTKGDIYGDNGLGSYLGFSYHGWLCLLLDSENRIVAVSSSNEAWQNSPEKAAILNVGDVFDHSFTIIRSGNRMTITTNPIE